MIMYNFVDLIISEGCYKKYWYFYEYFYDVIVVGKKYVNVGNNFIGNLW